ncbi:2-polyprenyl-6-hydroxyphenyl methylase/3-demethylubiquinone-9 3-methyltransferase [Constrictibacter sp. MBR-5]|jgi:SAM-dependent methyltransferase|uniref:class I SAM-dependent methyltransferase n=1 Tax=Constrictibacter sp. MBR-5 TaxID=3156467 RepID=UPI00339133C0
MKVADIRPDALMEGQQAAMQRDIAMLQARRAEFVETPCPACGDDAGAPLYEKYGMTHRRCAACATQYVSPRPSPAVLRDFYRGSENYAYFARHIFPASAEQRRERLFRPRAAMVADLARASGMDRPALVEVGAGYGLFCEEVRATGVFGRIVGVEPTPDLAGICRDKGIEVIESAVEEIDAVEPFDILAAFEVIEHLFDPAAFLTACRQLVRPGGRILLTCPNIQGFDTILLGSASSAVDHEHLNYFNPDSMALLLRRAGFEDIEVTTPGRLDVDLVRRALAEGTVAPAQLGPFLAHLLDRNDAGTDTLLQDFLRRARLSSNLQAVARLPA